MCKVQLKNARLRPFALFMALFLMNVSWAFAQLTVTGHVKSTSGDPLIGVNVVEKGTTNGTVTDMDGNFSLRVEKGKTLVFSYIGFLSQENVVRGNRMNITLKEDINPEKPDVPLNKNDAFQKVQKRRVQEKR